VVSFPSGFVIKTVVLTGLKWNILTILTVVLTGYYVRGIPSPALLQFIWLGYGTGLMMAQ
jgi:hypothetical protein